MHANDNDKNSIIVKIFSGKNIKNKCLIERKNKKTIDCYFFWLKYPFFIKIKFLWIFSFNITYNNSILFGFDLEYDK